MEPKIYKPSIYNGAGIYKAGAEGGGGGGNLLDDYDILGVLRFGRNSGVDIYNETLRDNDCKIKINFIWRDPSTDSTYRNIFGGGSTPSNPYSIPFIGFNNSIAGYIMFSYYNGSSYSSGDFQNNSNDGMYVEFIIEKGYFFFNSNYKAISYSFIQNTQEKFFLGAGYDTYNDALIWDFINMSVTRGGVVVSELVAARRKEDAVKGVLDLISGNFYTGFNLS